MKKIIVLFIFVLLMTGCKEKIHTKIPDDVNIKISEEDIIVYSDTKLNDIVMESNVDLIDEQLDTNSLGEHDLVYYFTYNNKKYKAILKYTVVDNEQPKIFGSKTKTVVIEYKGEVCNLVTYGDNYDANPVCSVEGDYDLSKVGSYPITINVKDSSENSKSFNFKCSF